MCTNFRVLIIGTFLATAAIAGDEKNESVFIPTLEWQTLKKGTPIPQGLHVRHNFQTGLTEAKLMDPAEMRTEHATGESAKDVALHPDEVYPQEYQRDSGDTPRIREGNDLKISDKELSQKLKKIRLDEQLLQPEVDVHSLNELRRTDTADVSITQTRMKLSNVTPPRFDLHKNAIIAGKLTLKEIEDILDVLSNLEYTVHQIDNGQSFASLGGLTRVVYPCLNSTNDEIKAEALRVLGSCVQSNPAVQAIALDNDFIKKLLHIITNNRKIEVRTKSLYALGALVRQFPSAQKSLVDHGGIQIFSKILAGGQLKTQNKVMKLINDLIVEREEHDEIFDIGKRKEKLREYAVVELERKLLEEKYCRQLGSLMVRSVHNEIENDFNMEDHDFLELIYESMIISGDICKFEFRTQKDILLPAMNQMLLFYHSLDTKLYPEEDDLFRHLVLLMEKLKRKIFEKSHDEL